MKERENNSPEYSVVADLLTLRTMAEKVRAFKTVNNLPVGPEADLKMVLEKSGDKLAKPDTLISDEQQGQLIGKIGEVRDLIFEHGESAVFEDELGRTEYTKVNFGIYSLYADHEVSFENTYLSFMADDKDNKANIDLTVNKDMKTYEFDISFLKVNGRRDSWFRSGEASLDKMTDVEFRILMRYMKQFISDYSSQSTEGK